MAQPPSVATDVVDAVTSVAKKGTDAAPASGLQLAANNFVKMAPQLVVGGAISFAAAYATAQVVNGIMNVLNLGGDNLAGTTETATMLDPSQLDPELMEELYIAADSGELIDIGTGEPITREQIDAGEAFYPDYLLRDMAEGGFDLDFDEAMGDAQRIGGAGDDQTGGYVVGGVKMQREAAMLRSPQATARMVSRLGLSQQGLDMFAASFAPLFKTAQNRIDFNNNPTGFMASKGWKVENGLLGRI